MKKTWYEIYMEEINLQGTVTNYVKDKIKTRKRIIDLIKKYSPNKKIIEAGAGTAILSTYLASLGYETVAIDIDKEIINLAKEISQKYGSINKPIFKQDSIFKLEYDKNEFDVSFSNGVLEHFSDEEIIDAIQKQMKIARTVIVGIPTKYFDDNEAMYGDERFLDIKYWRKLIEKAGGRIIEEKSCHFLTTPMIILNFRKYFRPYPYRLFVIQK